MKDKTNIIVLLLAAGKSSRFGSPKQLLKWKNSNLLQHAIKTASDSNASDVFLVLGANYDQIMEMIHTDSVRLLEISRGKKVWEILLHLVSIKF